MPLRSSRHLKIPKMSEAENLNASEGDAVGSSTETKRLEAVVTGQVSRDWGVFVWLGLLAATLFGILLSAPPPADG